MWSTLASVFCMQPLEPRLPDTQQRLQGQQSAPAAFTSELVLQHECRSGAVQTEEKLVIEASATRLDSTVKPNTLGQTSQGALRRGNRFKTPLTASKALLAIYGMRSRGASFTERLRSRRCVASLTLAPRQVPIFGQGKLAVCSDSPLAPLRSKSRNALNARE